MNKKIILIAIAAFLTVNVWGQNEFPLDANSIVKIDGGSIKLIRPITTGGWARGLSIYDLDETTRFSSFGLYGEENTPDRFYLAHGDSPWNSGLGMYILTNGNTGFGTTIPDNKLHVFVGESGGASYANSTLTLENNTSNFLQFLTPNTNVQGIMFGDPEHAYSGYIRYSHSDNSMRLYTNNTQRFAILSNGNVGIGTTEPLQKLEIKDGDLYINNSSDDGGTIRSYGHNLDFKGRTDNAYAHRSYRFYPATGSAATYSYLKLYQGNTDGTFDEKVKIASTGNSYFNGGNVGIGTTTPPYKLSVEGTIGAREVIVTSEEWADFVFESTYNLMPLKELDTYIQENKHLPEIPTTEEVKENGISIGEMNAKLLQKIEELTLYVIELKKENDELNDKVDALIKQ